MAVSSGRMHQLNTDMVKSSHTCTNIPDNLVWNTLDTIWQDPSSEGYHLGRRASLFWRNSGEYLAGDLEILF